MSGRKREEREKGGKRREIRENDPKSVTGDQKSGKMGKTQGKW